MQSATMPRTTTGTEERREPDMTRQLAPLGVVVASFYDHKHANDAIADLRKAGFGHDAVAITYPTNAKAGPNAEADRISASGAPPKHSWLWKFRQRQEEDLHQRGDQQMSSDGTLPESDAEQMDVNPTVITLREAFEMFGTYTRDRVAVLNHDMGPRGALLLIKCDLRAREVEALMERNAGTIRTAAVTTPIEPGESDVDVDERQPH